MPTVLRIAEGNRARRPVPANEPYYPAGIPERPAGMSAAAKKIWQGLAVDLSNSGVLRSIDALALAQLCEDQALLNELRKGLALTAVGIAKKAKEEGKALPGGALTSLSQTIEGRRILATIRELSSQVIIQRREFGLTPASSSRVEGFGPTPPTGSRMSAQEAALCG
jgi:phage terminase small subunit